jgi:hypothetical protein
MHRMLVFLLLLTTVPLIHASSLLVGTTLPNGIGDYSVIGAPGFVPQFLAQGFTLTSPAQVTGITLDMTGFGDSFTLWLSNASGPGTTMANVLLQTTLTFPSTGGDPNMATVSTSPSNLFLPAGSYFLIASSAQNSSPAEGWGIDVGGAILTSFGTVGQAAASCCAAGSSTNTAFPPGSTFVAAESPLAFQISGNPTPESSTVLLTGLGLLVALKARRRVSTWLK